MSALLTLALGTLGAQAANLLANPGWEGPLSGEGGLPEGWQPFTPSTGSIWGQSLLLSDVARTGKHGIQLHDVDNKGIGLRSLPVPAQPGHEYKASMWVKGHKGNSIYIEFWDSAGKRIHTKSTSLQPKDDWVQVVAQAVAPPATVSVTILAYSGAAATGDGYFDDAELVDLSQ